MRIAASSPRWRSRARRADRSTCSSTGASCKDRTIAHAIIDAYSVATIKERSPEVHLFIEMPPDAVDVNVHPTKAEVRFREQSLVHEVVRRALGDALGQRARAAAAAHAPETGRPVPATLTLPGVLASGVCPSRWRRLRGPGCGCRRSAELPEPSCRSRTARRLEPGAGRRDERLDVDPPDDSARPVPRHLHHRGGRRGHRDHRSARRARARAVRAGDGAADRRARSRASGCCSRCARLSPAARQALRPHAATSNGWASRSRSSAATACGLRRCRRCSAGRLPMAAVRALAEDLEGLDRGARVDDALGGSRRPRPATPP